MSLKVLWSTLACPLRLALSRLISSRRYIRNVTNESSNIILFNKSKDKTVYG